MDMANHTVGTLTNAVEFAEVRAEFRMVARP
jgi:hypothetical protein